MSIKVELQQQLKEIGYELGPFTSKDTLSIIRCLHSVVLTEKNVNVAKLSDLELRTNLIQRGFIVGPITNHTRAIYQRKLLEVLTNQTTNGQDDEFEIDESIYQTEYDINENNTSYPNIFRTKYSSGNSNSDNFQTTEPMIIRHDYKATSTSRNSSKRNTYEESNEIRPRIVTKSNEIKKDITSKKIQDKSTNKNDKLQDINKSNNGTFVYAAITIIVALVVFFAYLWFEK
ncbi:unnamed protein product [Rotaria sordida]|uniref:LEM domain-containing protein n=1 Tax=Rotaria sordida TaxID=392033 RepID=A0A819WLT2_9BILA|nr:unnamed protein product [Rotaria sordida]CAF4126323.1 unnamed protein product [Rotaria sordida]